MPPKKKEHDKYNTLAIVGSCLILGVPVSGVAINLNSTPMPDPPLVNPDALINGPHIALYAAAVIAIIASVIVAGGSTVLRHVSPNNSIVGVVMFGFAALNQAAQIIILALIYITNKVNPEATSQRDIRLIDGRQYDTGGRQFTRETWACSVINLYRDREPWSITSCNEYRFARYCTILLSACAFLLLAIAYWPVRKYIFGMNRSKSVV